MTAETGKYDTFSKVFCELSDEAQDKLVKIAHWLLKTHRYAQQENAEQQKIGKRTHTVGVQR